MCVSVCVCVCECECECVCACVCEYECVCVCVCVCTMANLCISYIFQNEDWDRIFGSESGPNRSTRRPTSQPTPIPISTLHKLHSSRRHSSIPHVPGKGGGASVDSSLLTLHPLTKGTLKKKLCTI